MISRASSTGSMMVSDSPLAVMFAIAMAAAPSRDG
jgi:hypothetical protein